MTSLKRIIIKLVYLFLSDLLLETINIFTACDLKLHFVHHFLASPCYTLSQFFVRHVHSLRSGVFSYSDAIMFRANANVHNWIHPLHNEVFLRFSL